MNISAILLAAGMSKRFGQDNKLLHEFKGKPLLHHAVQTLTACAVNQLIVVVGPNESDIKQCLHDFLPSPKIQLTTNQHFESGMASSIGAGVSACENADACLICLSDMPLVKSTTYDALLSFAVDRKAAQILVPMYQDRPGNPVLFKASQFTHLKNLSGDSGAKQLIAQQSGQNKELVMFVPVDDSGIHRDFDVAADFNVTD